MARNDVGDPGTWEAARELGKQLTFPVGPYEPRVPTADEMNAVIPYIMDRFSRFVTDKYFCENAEVTLAHIFGINVPRYGFPDSSGYNNNSRSQGYNRDWEGFDRNGLDRNGYNREGLDRNGYNREGYNKDGYNYYGYDKDGFNKDGRDGDGRTREEHVAALVTSWSPEFAAAIAAHVAQVKAVEPATEPATTKPAKKAAVAKKAAPVKKAPAKKAAPAAKVAARKVVPVNPRNPFIDVAPRRRDYVLAQ